MLNLKRWQFAALAAVSLISAIVSTGARIFSGEHQTIERLIVLNPGDYEVATSPFGSDWMKASHIDADSLFFQFATEFGQYQGKIAPKGVKAKALAEKKLAHIATLAISGPVSVTTPELMNKITVAVYDSIKNRTRRSLAAAQTRILAQAEASLDELAEFKIKDRSTALVTELGGLVPPGQHTLQEDDNASPFQRDEKGSSAPGTTVYVTDPLSEQMADLLMRKRLLGDLNVDQLHIPDFDIVQEQITPSLFNLPAWLVALIAASLAPALGYGLIVANRIAAINGD